MLPWVTSHAMEGLASLRLPSLAFRHALVLMGLSFLTGSVAAAAATVPTIANLLGVAPQDVDYYKTRPIIWCRDRFRGFSAERLNDDFCDCPDGTDEPGTSACPNGRFHCRNQKQTPLWIFSSRVNDGICDCCDGSDEYEGKVQCVPTCPEEVGDVSRKMIPREAADFKGSLEKEVSTLAQKDGVELSTRKQEESKLKDAIHKLKDLKMLMLLEMALIMLLWWHLYGWTRRAGHSLRRRLPR